MIEYEYWTEETEIMEYTEELKHLLHNSDKYRAIFDCFKRKNLPLLAEIMTSMVSALKELNTKEKEKSNTIEWLETSLAEKKNTIARLTTELEELRKQGGGADIQINNEMKALHEQGYSLRKISEILHKDRSTIKRKLIKMGYTFDWFRW